MTQLMRMDALFILLLVLAPGNAKAWKSAIIAAGVTLLYYFACLLALNAWFRTIKCQSCKAWGAAAWWYLAFASFKCNHRRRGPSSLGAALGPTPRSFNNSKSLAGPIASPTLDFLCGLPFLAFGFLCEWPRTLPFSEARCRKKCVWKKKIAQFFPIAENYGGFYFSKVRSSVANFVAKVLCRVLCRLLWALSCAGC